MAPLWKVAPTTEPNADKNWALVFSAMASLTIFVSMLFVLFLCTCGGEKEKEPEVEKESKGSKKAADEEAENEEGAEEAQEEEEQEPGSAKSSGKKSTKAKSKKKKASPKVGKKGKSSKSKKAAVPKKKPSKATPSQEDTSAEPTVLKGESGRTRAPIVMSAISKLNESGVTKKPQPKKNDPLYRTMFGAKSGVFDKTSTGKKQDEGCYIVIDDAKTNVPCKTPEDFTSAVENAERTEVPGATMAKAKTQIFDKKLGSSYK